MSSSGKIRVLVVDDSAVGRAAISEILEKAGGIEIVDRAMDGAEALRMVHQLQPDLLTLDLEMPRMDGFTLLRMLRVQRPTPVIVVSTDSRPEASIMALEFGALDFVVKPNRLAGTSLISMGEELIEKIRAAVGKQPPPKVKFERRPAGALTMTGIRMPPERVRLMVVGASTGGPMAVQGILGEITEPLACPMVVAQHMPANFTSAFAERLDRTLVHRVAEAEDGERLPPGAIYIAPGGKRTTVALNADGELIARVGPPGPRDQCSPSVDRLFETAAACTGAELVAVVLTGMGSDGARGAHAAEQMDAMVISESPETALIDGMPEEARRACQHAKVLRMDQIARLLWRLGRADRG